MDDVETLNALFNEWEVALKGAATAQKDVVVILREYLQGAESLPPATMQEVADALWDKAAEKRAEIADFFHQRVSGDTQT